MIDVQKHIDYWVRGSKEDISAADTIFDKHVRHALFFAHLSLEKILKALICKSTQKAAPRIHELIRLAKLADIKLSEEQIDVLAVMNRFCMEGRYPDSLDETPPPPMAKEHIRQTKAVRKWLASKL